MKKNEVAENSVIRIIPLGGLEQIGMNITAFESRDSIFIIDCGMGFPEDDMRGVDMVIPNVSYLEEHIDKVKGFVITHGHEDHIGALPYILKKINVPVYATKLTMGIIEHKLTEHNLMEITTRKVVSFGQTITLGDFHVEFIRTNHSIVDAAALAIYTPQGVIVHTGDFKVDYTPIYGDAIDLPRFGELGKKGVLALLCDSTNAERPGFTPSERTVGHTLDAIFEENPTRRIIVATFASNVDRVQQIINSANKCGRKVAIEGRSMVNIIDTAIALERISVPENILIKTDELKNYPEEKTVIITTGSQGERLAALSRMANNTHKKISIGPKDTVIFSSHPIPGNEKPVTKIINELFLKGADVVFQDTHVSGHACQEEIKLIYSLTQPKYAIPVHGEYKHLMAQAKIAKEMGVEKENIYLLRTGEVLTLEHGVARVDETVTSGAVLVDGLGVGDVGNIVLKDRQKLGESGIITISVVLDEEYQTVCGPEIYTKGFVYVQEAKEMLDEARMVSEEAIIKCVSKGVTDKNKIASTIRDEVSDFVWRRMKRSPMIVPIIMEMQ